MLKLSNQAKVELKKLLLRHKKSEEASIRLAFGTLGQFGLVLSKFTDGDEVIEDHGLKILLIGSEFRDILDGATVDVAYNGSSREFVVAKRRAIEKDGGTY